MIAFVKSVISISVVSAGIFTGGTLFSKDEALAKSVGKSGLPLPRFVSIKANKVNMRVGPGTDYKVDWMYTKSGLPLEILQEYDNWRKVRDSEGAEGWISKSLLSGKRTAIVAPWKKGEANSYITMKNDPSSEATVVAKMEPGLVVKVSSCQNSWCQVEANAIKGYAQQTQLWGVYPDETVK